MLIQPIHVFSGHNSAVYDLSHTHHPSTFLSAAGDGWVVSWNLDTLESGRLLASVDTNLFCLAYLPDTQWAIVGGMDGGVYWVDLQTKKVLHKQTAHSKGCFGLCATPQRVYSIGADGCLRVWTFSDSIRIVETLHLNQIGLRSIQATADAQQLLIGGKCGTLFVLDLHTLAILQTIPQTHDSTIFSVCSHPLTGTIYTGGKDAMLKSWHIPQSLPLNPFQQLPAHLSTINSIAIHPNHTLIATASRDKTIKIWDAQTLELLKVIDAPRYGGHIRSVNSLYWSSYNDYLVSASDDRLIRVWSVQA